MYLSISSTEYQLLMVVLNSGLNKTKLPLLPQLALQHLNQWETPPAGPLLRWEGPRWAVGSQGVM